MNTPDDLVPTLDQLRAGVTLAEIQGFPAELGMAVIGLAGNAAQEGDLDLARAILEGIVCMNPKDAIAWAMLSQVARRQGEPFVAVLCAEAASRLDPGDRQVRLVRVEALLGIPAEAGPGREGRAAVARADLADLAGGDDPVASRAASLLRALGG